MLFSILLLAGLAVPPEAAGRLVLEASSPQQTVLLGEPLKIVVRWRAERAPVKVASPNYIFSSTAQQLGFRIEDSAGSREYGEELRGHLEVQVAVQLRPGEELVSDLVLLYGLDNEHGQGLVVPCKHTGPCSIRVIYEARDAHAESNPVRFDVRPPTGPDKEVFAAIEKGVGVLGCDYPGGPAQARALLARFPDSPYLRWAALRCLDQDLHVLYSSFRDPETGEGIAGLREPERKSRTRAADRRILDKLLALGHLGPFEPERLDLALGCALRADEELAPNLRAELLSRYPDSQAAIRRREQEKKHEAAEDDKE